jgi:hypothetical protein
MATTNSPESLQFFRTDLINHTINAYLGKTLDFGGSAAPRTRPMQKKPLALFSGIAAAGILAFGYSYNLKTQQPETAKTETVAEKPVGEKKPEATAQSNTPAPEAKPVEQAAKPAAAETQVAVATEPPKPTEAALEGVDTAKLPAFDTVRVEPTGEAVIAGRAEPGAAVMVKFNGQVVGEGVANSAGEFAIIPEQNLQKGTGALTLVMSKNGAMTESEGSVVISLKDNAPVMVAKVEPTEPTVVTQVPAEDAVAASKDVQLNAVDYDSAGNIVFTGRALPGSTVRFYVDNQLAGEVPVELSGRWIFKGGKQVPVGQHMLRADQVDQTGKVLSRIELPFLRETEETVAAAQQPAPAEQPVAKVEAPAAPEQKVATAEPETVAPAAPVIPKPAAKMAGEQMVPQRIVIQPGHNLWKLSRQIYGRGKLYTVIYKANKDQLRSPHRIYPGQILTAPIKQAGNAG